MGPLVEVILGTIFWEINSLGTYPQVIYLDSNKERYSWILCTTYLLLSIMAPSLQPWDKVEGSQSSFPVPR